MFSNWRYSVPHLMLPEIILWKMKNNNRWNVTQCILYTYKRVLNEHDMLPYNLYTRIHIHICDSIYISRDCMLWIWYDPYAKPTYICWHTYIYVHTYICVYMFLHQPWQIYFVTLIVFYIHPNVFNTIMTRYIIVYTRICICPYAIPSTFQVVA